MSNLKDIKALTDRELLEFVLANQVNLMQRIYRMTNFILESDVLSAEQKQKFIQINQSKSETFEKMLAESDNFWMQLED